MRDSTSTGATMQGLMLTATRRVAFVRARRSPRAELIALTVCALALGACGDDDGDRTGRADGAAAATVPPPSGSVDAGVNIDGSVVITAADGAVIMAPVDAAPPTLAIDAASVAPPPVDALYAISTWVSSGDDSTAYVKIVPSLQTETRVTLDDALEVPGYGDIHVEAGKLYVSDGESPIIRRYAVAPDGKLAREAELNFSRYSDEAAMYMQRFVDHERAYLRTDTSFIKWNPSTMMIEKEIPYPEQVLAERDGLPAWVVFDRGSVPRGDRLYHAVQWVDYESYKFAPRSGIMVLDTKTDQIISVLDAPCPGLDVGTVDAVGDLYFSGWPFGAGATLVNQGAKACAVKIPAGSDALDPTFTLVFADVTGGHEGANMRYLGDSKFLLSVFDEAHAPFDPKSDLIAEWVLADNWTYGLLDMQTRAFTALPALGYHDGAYSSARPGGQFFLLTNSAETGSTTYQQVLPDGSVKKGISVDGWSTRAYRVR